METTETDKPTAEEILAARAKRMTWFGYLADDTVEEIASRIRNLLEGRRYTFVTLNVDNVSRIGPEVRTGQELKPTAIAPRPKESIRVHRLSDEQEHPSCGISVSDSYGAWGIHSSELHESTCCDLSWDETKAKSLTYVHIEGGREPDDLPRYAKIEIRQYNYMSPRQQLVWVIAPEVH